LNNFLSLSVIFIFKLITPSYIIILLIFDDIDIKTIYKENVKRGKNYMKVKIENVEADLN
jgi:hypothetical protein